MTSMLSLGDGCVHDVLLAQETMIFSENPVSTFRDHGLGAGENIEQPGYGLISAG
jgi:hypothetical protein